MVELQKREKASAGTVPTILEKMAERIKTGIYLLDQQITSIEQQKNDKKIQVCLNITPAFERKMAESIKLLDKEALQLMRLNLGINFTPPPKGYNEPC